MGASQRGRYAAIDVHAKQADAWPATLPPLTAEEAQRAAKRLYRWGMGQAFEGRIFATTGNRRAVRFAWGGNVRDMHINASKGWREFVHDLSHWLDYLANGRSKHGKHHQRFEARMVREVLARGWLDGKLLREKPAPAPASNVVSIDRTTAARREKLARIEARILNWERKAKRAKNALAKLAKQQRYYVKALAA